MYGTELEIPKLNQRWLCCKLYYHISM